MKTRKTLLALLLVFCMAASLLPVTGSAADGWTYKMQTRVEEYDADGTLVAYTDTRYDDNGNYLGEQSFELRDVESAGPTFVETYYSELLFDENGSQTGVMYRQEGDTFTETYSYEWPSEYVGRTITHHSPENYTTINETTYDKEWNVLRDVELNEDGSVIWESVYTYRADGSMEFKKTTYPDYTTVTVFDDYGNYVFTFDCSDPSAIQIARAYDANGELQTFKASCGDESCTETYQNGERRQSVSERKTPDGTLWRNETTWGANGGSETERYYRDGVLSETHTYECDADGYMTKRTDTDADGNVTWTYKYQYREFKYEPPQTFEDVAPGKFYFEAVEWAADWGIAKGTSETTFSPNKTCTRGEAVTFLWRAMGKPMAENQDNPFTDVSPKKFYYQAVLWAVENGIAKGVGNGRFDPNGTCTRAEIVTFLWRLAGQQKPVSPASFSDVPTGKWYSNAIGWAVENGITKGTGGNLFQPSKTCTRGEIVTFLFRHFIGE